MSPFATLVVLVTFLGTTALLVGLGYLIRERSRLDLWTLYRPERTLDPEGLARFVGTICYWMALATLIVPFLVFLFPSERSVIWIMVGYVLAIAALVVGSVRGSNRYLR